MNTMNNKDDRMKTVNFLAITVILLSSQVTLFGFLYVPDNATYVLDHVEGNCYGGNNCTFIVEDGGWADYVSLSTGSKLITNGGYISWICATYATINAGEIYSFGADEGEMFGGIIHTAWFQNGYIGNGDIGSLDINGTVTIAGGDIDYVTGYLGSKTHIYSAGVKEMLLLGASVYFYADCFKWDGVDVGYGVLNSETVDVPHLLEYQLPNGETGKTTITLMNPSNIFLIPEPGMMVLVGLGIMMVRRTRKL